MPNRINDISKGFYKNKRRVNLSISITKNKNKNPISFLKKKKATKQEEKLVHKSNKKEEEKKTTWVILFLLLLLLLSFHPTSLAAFSLSFFHLCHVFGVDRQIEYGLDNLPINFSIIKVRS
jgi:flagellar biosynthesis protein FliP